MSRVKEKRRELNAKRYGKRSLPSKQQLRREERWAKRRDDERKRIEARNAQLANSTEAA